MVVVRIELWPLGQQDKAILLGVCNIVNDGGGDSIFGDYDVQLSHAGKYIRKKGIWKEGRITHHRRSLSPYHLVYAAIKSCLWPSKTRKANQ